MWKYHCSATNCEDKMNWTPSTFKGFFSAVFRKKLKPKDLVDRLRSTHELFFDELEETLDALYDQDIDISEAETRTVHSLLGANGVA